MAKVSISGRLATLLARRRRRSAGNHPLTKMKNSSSHAIIQMNAAIEALLAKRGGREHPCGQVL
jgi:hypothetical protein